MPDDGKYIQGPIGTPGSQVTVNGPGGSAETGLVGGNDTVHIGDKTYQIERK